MTMFTVSEVIKNLREERQKLQDKIDKVINIQSDVCDDYGTETCQEGIRDCDPTGWEGCLTRKILNVLEVLKAEG